MHCHVMHSFASQYSVDEVEDQNALIYNYVIEYLHQLTKRFKFNRSLIKRICREVLQPIAELHDAD